MGRHQPPQELQLELEQPLQPEEALLPVPTKLPGPSPALKAQTDIFFCTFLEPHTGHTADGSDILTSDSNSALQSLQ